VPFAPVHLLFINLLTDSLPAIALGLEPDRSEVMSEKPRLADESILTKDFLSKIGLEGLVIGAMTMISFLTGYNQNGTLLGSTYAFGTLCLARLFHGYNCKSDHPVIFTKGLFHNKWLQGAFDNHQITAVDMHAENLDSDQLICYPLLSKGEVRWQNK